MSVLFNCKVLKRLDVTTSKTLFFKVRLGVTKADGHQSILKNV